MKRIFKGCIVTVLFTVFFMVGSNYSVKAYGNELIKLSKIGELDTENQRIFSIEFIPNSNKAIGITQKGELFVWDCETTELLSKIEVTDAENYSNKWIKVNHKGDLVVVTGRNGIVETFNIKAGELVKTYPTDNYIGSYVSTNYAMFSNDDKMLYSILGNSSDGTLIFWDTESGKALKKIKFDSGVAAFDYLGEKELIAIAFNDGSLQFRNAKSGKLVKRIDDVFRNSGKYELESIKFSPDGNYLTVSNTKYRNFLEIDIENDFEVFQRSEEILFWWTNHIEIDQQQSIVFVQADQKNYILDYETRKQIATIDNEQGDISYNPEYKLLLKGNKVYDTSALPTKKLVEVKQKEEVEVIRVGDDLKIDLVGIYDDGSVKDIKFEDTTWKSLDYDIATAKDNIIHGRYKGVAELSAKIKNEDLVYKCKIVVRPENTPLKEIKIAKDNMIFNVGKKRNIEATLIPGKLKNKNLIWKSSNDKIVSIISDGTIKGMKEGIAVVSVQTEDGLAKEEIYVQVVSEEQIIISKTGSINEYSDVSQDEEWIIKLDCKVNKENIKKTRIEILDKDNNIIPVYYYVDNKIDAINIIPIDNYIKGETYSIVIKNNETDKIIKEVQFSVKK